MAVYDSIVNVEEWISDYYLTTDETKGESFTKRVDSRIKEWKADEAGGAGESPWVRFHSRRGELQAALATLGTDASLDQAHSLLREALGYGELSTQNSHRLNQHMQFQGWQGAGGSVMLLEAQPVETAEDFREVLLLGEVTIDDKPQDLTAADCVGELFNSDAPPEFIVVLAGGWVVVAERESWPLGRYLMVNLALVVERNDAKAKGEMQRAAVILARENTERAADGTTWWSQTIEQSREHAIKVSGELRTAVRESIEIIGNDILDRHRAQDLAIDDIDGNELAKQSLRYLYRILFLLFAEASPELEILPTGAPEYDAGYGLSRLRELILDPPVTQQARSGTHLYQSLEVLFRLVNQGHTPADSTKHDHEADALDQGLQFRNLSADLFLPEATSLIDKVQLSNAALNQVLENLLLSRVQNKKDRGFISYATLGVTELGQVYEGLMSYTGFIAQEDLLEVAPKGDASKGSWVVPEQRTADLPADSFVQVEQEAAGGGVELVNRRHKKGSFVFRQASRDRERSASFYTPQVLTEFTVGQAIEVLQEEGRLTTSADILSLSICEPAMGSGAFAVEAVRQLADLYLTLREKELDQQVPAADRTVELQKVKASIALHQVYGVDLNRTAVELAEISLWLDTMTAGLQAPWFGLHLRHGNSLIGARRATFAAKDLRTRTYLGLVPEHHSVESVAESIKTGDPDTRVTSRIHHFLVPSKGWGATADAKDLKDVVSEEQKALKNWCTSIQKGLSPQQIKDLQAISRQVERLWQLALVRLRIAEDQARRDIELWGSQLTPTARNVSREQIEAELFNNPDGAYQRLRLVMDAWNALWFWPLTEVQIVDGVAVNLPDIDEWISTLRDIIGIPYIGKAKTEGQYALGFDLSWDELDATEKSEIAFSQAKPTKQLENLHPWLAVAREVAAEQAFFHWDLDFAAVMSKGGFDLQVGNPPWVRPRTDVDALLSEHDPWFNLAHKPTQAEKRERRELLTVSSDAKSTLVKGIGETIATAAVLGDVSSYPHLKNQQPDLYRGFMERTWSNASDQGVVSLIHPESHFTEKKAASLRSAAYRRLRRHWQFINALMLFDIDDHVVYGVHIYGAVQASPRFISAGRMYHPQTAADSVHHDGSGPLPGIKDDNYNWDLRPHRDRIITVDEHELAIWKSILEEPSTPLLETRMVYTVNSEAAAVLEKLASAPRMSALGLQFSSGWHESGDKKKGYFDTNWQHPESWDDVILQGPHLGVSTPMIKQPNPTMKHNQDWSEIDLEAVPEDFIPATAYFPNRAGKHDYDTAYGTWDTPTGPVLVTSTFRIAWRRMAATTGFRTLYPAIIPPGSRHVNGIISAGPLDSIDQILGGVLASSVLVDFFLRSRGVGDIYGPVFNNLPAIAGENYRIAPATSIYLRLNCLSSAYAPLWESITNEPWTPETPLRNAWERQLAQIEIDALVALSLGVTADELCMIYRTQFPVMRRYDQENLFDAHGRLVPKHIARAEVAAKTPESLSEQERTWVHSQSNAEYRFDYPFRILDREAEIRKAFDRHQPQANLSKSEKKRS